MFTKTAFATLAATAVILGVGFAPALAKSGVTTVGVSQSVADAQRRCASAINGEQALEILGRCGIER